MALVPGVTPPSALIPGTAMIGYHLGPGGRPGQGFGGQGDAWLALQGRNLWWGRVGDFAAENVAENLGSMSQTTVPMFWSAGVNQIPDATFSTAEIGKQVWVTDGSFPFNTYAGPSSTAGQIHLSSSRTSQVNVTTLKGGTGPIYRFSSSPFTSRLNNYVGYTGVMLIAVVPFPQTFTNSNGNVVTAKWTDVSAGTFDAAYRAMGLQFVASGYGNAIIRIAIESDGTWFYWALQYPTPATAIHTPAAFKAGFAHMATVLKTTPGSNFTIEYNIALYNNWDPNVSLPDPTTFDICGTDRYDEGAYGTSYGPTDHVNMWAKETFPKLEITRKMADLHGLPMAVSESSFAVTRQDGHGGGDDAYGLTQMAAYMASVNFAYFAWFDAYDGTQTARTQNNCLTEQVNPSTGTHGPFATADGSQPGSNTAVQAAAVWRGPLYAPGAIQNGVTTGGGGGTPTPTTATIGSGRKTRYSALLYS